MAGNEKHPSSVRLISTKRLYSADILGVRLDAVSFGGQNAVARHVVEYRPACAVVAFDRTLERVLLIQHYRYPIRRQLWELPGGVIEEDETDEAGARRELAEETGTRATNLKTVVRFYPEPAFTDHVITIFRTVVEPADAAVDPQDPEIGAARWVDQRKIWPMIRRGDIASSWSIIGLVMALAEI